LFILVEKLFVAETEEHILSKSYAIVDLSQLPVGAYLLENNRGESIVINRLEETIQIDAIMNEVAEEEYDTVAAENDVDTVYETEVVYEAVVNVEEEVAELYTGAKRGSLNINREGDLVTVLDFKDGDKIKLFEVEDDTHILTKTSNLIDLSLLAAGEYLLENSNGDSVVIKKFENVEIGEETTTVVEM